MDAEAGPKIEAESESKTEPVVAVSRGRDEPSRDGSEIELTDNSRWRS